MFTFASPSVTMTETNFEAALSYTLTGVAGGSTLTGGGLADTLTSGGGATAITGAGGIDIITGAGGVDTITLATAQADADVVETFTSTTDKIKITTTLLNVADATITNAGDISGSATIDAAIAVSATGTQYIFSNAAFDLDLTAVTDGSSVTSTELAAITTAARTALNATAKTNLDATFLATETVLFVLDDSSDTSSAIFSFNNSTATGNTIDDGELILVGVVDANAILANGDLIL